MIRFSLLLTCSLFASTLVGEHTAFAMNQDDNDDAPQTAPTPINWAAIAAFYDQYPIQGAAIPLPAEDKKDN
jgi:hypothetical protein